MRTAFKALTALLGVTGCAAVVATGEARASYAIACLVLLPGYWWHLRGWAPAPSGGVHALSGLALLLFAAESLVTRDVFLATAHLTLMLQIIKAFDLRGPWDHLQVFFIALLQLVIASELSTSAVFGIVFVCFMLLLVPGLMLSHIIQEGGSAEIRLGRMVWLVTAVVMIGTGILFVSLPRVAHRLAGRGHLRTIRTSGFSDVVEFGSFGSVKLDPTIVMRVTVEGSFSGPYYWRGTSLDFFDGFAWRQSYLKKRALSRSGERFVTPFADSGTPLVQHIYLEPVDSAVLFGLSAVMSLQSDLPAIFTTADSTLYAPGRLSRGLHYTVQSDIARDGSGMPLGRYLYVPPHALRPAHLAQRIAAGARGDAARASAIERHLKTSYAYSLSPPAAPVGVGPVDNFLFYSKKGYCEHFASAMVIMLRTLGIPARIVTGFSGGEVNTYGNYIIVRKSDAHAWVEAYIEAGWHRFDPTPSTVKAATPPGIALLVDAIRMKWSRYVVGFNTDDQRDILRMISNPAPDSKWPRVSLLYPSAAAVVILVVLAAFLSFRRRLIYAESPRLVFMAGYRSVVRALRRKGITVTPSTTAGMLRRMVKGTSCAVQVDEFIGTYERYRFGADIPDDRDRDEFDRTLRGARRAIRRM